MDYNFKISFIFFLMFFLIFNISYPIGNNYDNSTYAEELKNELKTITSYPELHQSFWGVVVQSVNTGKIVYEENAHKLFMPASVQKIITACVALSDLGENFTFSTKFYTDGTVNNGVLNGNLIVFSDGNPSISFRNYSPNGKPFFHKWANILKEKGISSINGSIITIDETFDEYLFAPGWMYEDMSYWWGAEISGVQFNENTIIFNGLSGKNVGDPIEYSFEPNTKYVKFINQATTIAKQDKSDTSIWFERETSENTIYIKGSLAIGETFDERAAIHNPSKYFATVMKEAFEEKGITISGEPKQLQKKDPSISKQSLTLLDIYNSPPLKSIVISMLKYSNNFYAETILRYMGYKSYQIGSFDNGIKVVKNYLKKWGISDREYNIKDGSGVCRYNFLTPMVLLKVLKNAFRENWFSTFYDGLPIAGKDGTLSKRLINTSAQGNLRAKTGYIYGAYSLCGYVTAKNNQLYSFVILINNFNLPTSSISYYHDLICERLANISNISED